ncbi:unnamed protein product [Prunus armeniaca]
MGSSSNWEQLGMGVLHQPKGSTKWHSINREMYTHSKGSHSIQPKIHLSHPLSLPSPLTQTYPKSPKQLQQAFLPFPYEFPLSLPSPLTQTHPKSPLELPYSRCEEPLGAALDVEKNLEKPWTPQNRLERELATAKEQAIATFEGLAIHTDLPGSSPSNSESSSDQEEEEEMAANEFMEDLDIPTIPASPSSILLPTVARNYELKSSHLNMLPSFYGLPNEDPLTHINDIFNAVSSFPLTGVTEDQLRMRVLPYILKDKAKYWLNSLKPGSLTTWGAIQKKFLEKYFSTQKTDMLRDKILLFAQQDDESFCEAWERFNGLLNQCPHHGIPLKLQMRMFYKGLTPSSHNIVANFAGGFYKTKTPEETYELFEEIAIETQHTDTRDFQIGTKAICPPCIELKKPLKGSV